MLHSHLHPTERSIYALSMLCFIGLVALLPWDPGAHGRSASGGIAGAMHRRMVSASVEEAQNFAAARLCRGVSASRCGAYAGTAAL